MNNTLDYFDLFDKFHDHIDKLNRDQLQRPLENEKENEIIY